MIEGRDKVVYDTPVSNTDNTWLARVEQYKEKSQRLSGLQNTVKAIKADLKQLEGYFTEQIPDGLKTFDKDGIRATKVERTGSIDYEKVLKAIEDHFNAVIPQDLIEKCRKTDSEYYRITVSNEPTKTEAVQTEQPKVESRTAETSSVSHEQPGEASVEVETPKSESVQEEPVATPQPELSLPSAPIPQGNFFEKSQSNMFF